MKLYPHEKGNNISVDGMWPIVPPVELNDGIYLHNVRHDKVTLTPYFNSYTPLKGYGSGSTTNDMTEGGMRLDLPFSCAASFSPMDGYNATDNYTYNGSFSCDHEHFAAGEARKIGHTGYSFITSDSKEFYLPVNGNTCGTYYIKKDKDNHLDWEHMYINNSKYTSSSYATLHSSAYILDENLKQANPNLVICGNGGHGAAVRGVMTFGRIGNTTGIAAHNPISYSYNSAYAYNSTSHQAWLCPQFLARSADYIFVGLSRIYRTGNGLSYHEVHRYNKGTNTVTVLNSQADYNYHWPCTFSNSITDDGDADIEHMFVIRKLNHTLGSPDFLVKRQSINKVTGTHSTDSVADQPSRTSTSYWPIYFHNSLNYATSWRSTCFVSEIGTSGEDVASGSIEVGRDYRVVDDAVTYNSVAYSVGDLVTGVSTVHTYTGDGKLQTLTKKFLSHLPIGQHDGSYSAASEGWRMMTMNILNTDINSDMYKTSTTTPTHNHVQPEVSDTRIKAYCGLDPYYNRILMLTNQTATIMQISSAGAWSTVKQFQGNYHSAGMDSTGRLFLLEEGAPHALHMYTTDLPYQVSIIPNKTNYTYAGTTLNTHLSAKATNFEDANVQTLLKLNIHGSAAQFTDGTQTKTITTSTTVPIKVDFNVVAGGYFKIDAEATSN